MERILEDYVAQAAASAFKLGFWLGSVVGAVLIIVVQMFISLVI